MRSFVLLDKFYTERQHTLKGFEVKTNFDKKNKKKVEIKAGKQSKENIMNELTEQYRNLNSRNEEMTSDNDDTIDEPERLTNPNEEKEEPEVQSLSYKDINKEMSFENVFNEFMKD